MPYIAVGATAVGTGLSIAGNEESQSAMNAARANEVAQQAALQKQSNAVFQNSLSQSTPQTAQRQMQQGTAARANAWQNLQNATTPIATALPTAADGATTTTSSGASSPTSSAAQRATTAGDTWNSLLANAAAKEGGYSDWENQQNIKNANAAQKLSVLNNFSQGDAALLPTELQVASQAGDGLSGWGSIVSSLGSLAGYANKAGLFSQTPSAAMAPAGGAAFGEPALSSSAAGQNFADSLVNGNYAGSILSNIRLTPAQASGWSDPYND